MPAGQYLATALHKLGCFTRDDVGGERPLDWQTLWAFGQATGAIEEPWEYELLADMSAAYLRGRQEGMDVLSMSPVMRAG